MKGANLSVGDLHFSQGDGEMSFCGAIEMVSKPSATLASCPSTFTHRPVLSPSAAALSRVAQRSSRSSSLSSWYALFYRISFKDVYAWCKQPSPIDPMYSAKVGKGGCGCCHALTSSIFCSLSSRVSALTIVSLCRRLLLFICQLEIADGDGKQYSMDASVCLASVSPFAGTNSPFQQHRRVQTSRSECYSLSHEGACRCRLYTSRRTEKLTTDPR